MDESEPRGASCFLRKGIEARGRHISLHSFSFVGYPFLTPSSLAARDIMLLLQVPLMCCLFLFSSARFNIRIYSPISITESSYHSNIFNDNSQICFQSQILVHFLFDIIS